MKYAVRNAKVIAAALGLAAIARATARREFIGQKFNDAPLIGAGILRLVHQNVVNAAVETEQNPLRNQRIGQQSLGIGDKIVEIEPAPRLFPCLVFRQENGGEAVQNGGAFGGSQRNTGTPRGFDTAHQVFQPVQKLAQFGLRGFGWKRP